MPTGLKLNAAACQNHTSDALYVFGYFTVIEAYSIRILLLTQRLFTPYPARTQCGLPPEKLSETPFYLYHWSLEGAEDVVQHNWLVLADTLEE